MMSKLIEQATRDHGHCFPDRRGFLWEEQVPLSLVNGEADLKKRE
jgi:hypothetical protein